MEYNSVMEVLSKAKKVADNGIFTVETRGDPSHYAKLFLKPANDYEEQLAVNVEKMMATLPQVTKLDLEFDDLSSAVEFDRGVQVGLKMMMRHLIESGQIEASNGE